MYSFCFSRPLISQVLVAEAEEMANWAKAQPEPTSTITEKSMAILNKAFCISKGNLLGGSFLTSAEGVRTRQGNNSRRPGLFFSGIFLPCSKVDKRVRILLFWIPQHLWEFCIILWISCLISAQRLTVLPSVISTDDRRWGSTRGRQRECVRQTITNAAT